MSHVFEPFLEKKIAEEVYNHVFKDFETGDVDDIDKRHLIRALKWISNILVLEFSSSIFSQIRNRIQERGISINNSKELDVREIKNVLKEMIGKFLTSDEEIYDSFGIGF